MDPVTHTMAGAVLARAGLQRMTPLAATTLVLAANAPDVDIVTAFAGEYASLAHRRGWSHGPLALLVLPFVVAGCVLAWDRWVRSKRVPDGPRARFRPVLALAFVGVVSHPLLDWLNTYGIRFLMPFSGRWFYGDSVFIIDPWLWLVLGGALYLAGPHSRGRTLGWGGLVGLLSLPVLLADPVPGPARGVWLAGLAAVVLLRRAYPHGLPLPGVRTAAFAAGVYVLALVAASAVGEGIGRREAERSGIAGIREVLYSPLPANPFAADLVVVTDGGYHSGGFRWFGDPRTDFDPEILPRGDWNAPAVLRALESPEARDYLVWARFPYVEVRATPGGREVFLGDARYRGRGSLGGVSVFVGEGAR